MQLSVDNQFDGIIGRMGTFRSDVIAGTLLNDQLVLGCERHVGAVPVEAFLVMIDLVEEVHFDGDHGDFRMQIQHLHQGPGATFPHSDDEEPRQVLPLGRHR